MLALPGSGLQKEYSVYDLNASETRCVSYDVGKIAP
jgi:hypothetical protein